MKTMQQRGAHRHSHTLPTITAQDPETDVLYRISNNSTSIDRGSQTHSHAHRNIVHHYAHRDARAKHHEGSILFGCFSEPSRDLLKIFGDCFAPEEGLRRSRSFAVLQPRPGCCKPAPQFQLTATPSTVTKGGSTC